MWRNCFADQSKDEIDKRVHRIVVLLHAKAEKLPKKMLAAISGKFHDAHLDVPRRDAQSSALVLDQVHGLNRKSAALHFLGGDLLVGHCLNKSPLLIGLDLRTLSSVSMVSLNVMRRMIGFGRT